MCSTMKELYHGIRLDYEWFEWIGLVEYVEIEDNIQQIGSLSVFLNLLRRHVSILRHDASIVTGKKGPETAALGKNSSLRSPWYRYIIFDGGDRKSRKGENEDACVSLVGCRMPVQKVESHKVEYDKGSNY